MKKLLSFILVCVLIIGIAPVQAFATDTPSTYEFHQDGIHISVAYSLNGSAVTEKMTITENNTAESVVERVITPDGTLKVYANGSLQETSHSDFYKSFLDLAQNKAVQISSPKTRAYGCGLSATHSYVRENSSTIDVRAQQGSVSALVNAVASILPFPVNSILTSLTTFLQGVNNSDANYIDVTQIQYYVHDGMPNQDLECYHVRFISYNRTSSGGRDVFDTHWEYYQYYI